MTSGRPGSTHPSRHANVYPGTLPDLGQGALVGKSCRYRYACHGDSAVGMIPPVEIRDFRIEDARHLTDLFHQAVRRGAQGFYEPHQLEAWAPEPPNYAEWERNLRAKPPVVAVQEGSIVGFMTLEPNGHIDWTYTHPDYHRRGVASALYAHLEREAHGRGLPRLFVEASKLARPFFAKQGFRIVGENQICRGTISLTNWTMEKFL